MNKFLDVLNKNKCSVTIAERNLLKFEQLKTVLETSVCKDMVAYLGPFCPLHFHVFLHAFLHAFFLKCAKRACAQNTWIQNQNTRQTWLSLHKHGSLCFIIKCFSKCVTTNRRTNIGCFCCCISCYRYCNFVFLHETHI